MAVYDIFVISDKFSMNYEKRIRASLFALGETAGKDRMPTTAVIRKSPFCEEAFDRLAYVA